MKPWKRFQTSAAVTACWIFVFPPACVEAQQTTNLSEVRDVELAADGMLQGRVVTSEGTAIGGAPVVVKQHGQTVVDTRTEFDGSFRVPSLRGGVYQLTVVNQNSNLRVWTHRTAPPAARTGVLVVSGDVQRGQGCTDDSCTGTCGGSCGACGVAGGPLSFLMNPFVIGAAVAAAIAIPLALNDDDAS